MTRNNDRRQRLAAGQNYPGDDTADPTPMISEVVPSQIETSCNPSLTSPPGDKNAA